MNRTKVSDCQPGDIIADGKGNSEYIFKTIDGDVGINAVNPSWIARGLRDYGDELYLLDQVYLDGYQIVGHFGVGSQNDGIEWYNGEIEHDESEDYIEED